MVAEARLIGVGESVHEVQTFLTFRFQLLQDLVRRHRVTALVLESGLPEAMALDDYVRGRTARVDFDAALPGGFGSLAEIQRTMEWIREWNLGPGRERPVGVYGADLPARSGSMVPALDRLLEVTAGDPGVKSLIDAVRPSAVQASGAWWRAASEKYAALSADAKAALAADVSCLVERVNRLSRGDADRLEWARRLALVVQQNEASLRLGMFAPSAPRDQAMAENTLWVLGRLAADERAVYWAHNAHVQRVPVQGPTLPPGSFPSAGSRLGAALGKKYLAIATACGGPSMDKATTAEGGSVDAALKKSRQAPSSCRFTPMRVPQLSPRGFPKSGRCGSRSGTSVCRWGLPSTPWCISIALAPPFARPPLDEGELPERLPPRRPICPSLASLGRLLCRSSCLRLQVNHHRPFRPSAQKPVP